MAGETQKYRPYRSQLLSAEQLHDLGRRHPVRMIRDTILLWLQIVIVWAAVAWWPSWWMIALAIPIVGTRYYALFLIGHDGLHRRLFRDVRTNDLWNDLLAIGPIGAITRLNRTNHMRHHATLALSGDPDRYKYIAGNRETRIDYGLALTGIPYVLRAVGNVFLGKRPTTAAPNQVAGYTGRDLAILGLWQVALVGGLSGAIGWWAYPVLWLLPVYIFTYAADIVRVFLEHSVPGNDDDADATMRLITYESNAIERVFFAPMNMNFHTAHHLWPSIPYYNLPKADRLIRQSPLRDGGLVWRGSYLAYLWEYGVKLPWFSGAMRRPMTALDLSREAAETGSPPHIAVEPVGLCMVCGGREFATIARGADYELQTCSNEWTFRQCGGCGHVQLDPRPVAAALPVIYPPHYYSYDMEKSVGRVALAGKALLDHRKFARILAFLGRQPRAYLDIGCGDLKYLELMRGMGLSPDRLFGLELDDRVVERARVSGFRVFAERVETTAAIPAGEIDLATMFHVIEHVADPGAVIRKIAAWLAPDGILALETPNFESLDARLFRSKYWGGYHIPRHWHIFSPRSLTRLLRRNGFTVEAIWFQTGHSFWLYSVHHLIRYNRFLPMPRVARLFDPMKSLPLLVLATLFDTVRAMLGFRTSAMLIIARPYRACPIRRSSTGRRWSDPEA